MYQKIRAKSVTTPFGGGYSLQSTTLLDLLPAPQSRTEADSLLFLRQYICRVPIRCIIFWLFPEGCLLSSCQIWHIWHSTCYKPRCSSGNRRPEQSNHSLPTWSVCTNVAFPYFQNSVFREPPWSSSSENVDSLLSSANLSPSSDDAGIALREFRLYDFILAKNIFPVLS